MTEENEIKYLWKDKKRILGMPISFTKYSLSQDRLFIETGFFNSKYEEIILYRITDLTLKRNLIQKIFGVGSIIVNSSDKTMPIFEIKNIKNSFKTKEILHKYIEKAKKEHRIRIGEMISDTDTDDIF